MQFGAIQGPALSGQAFRMFNIRALGPKRGLDLSISVPVMSDHFIRMMPYLVASPQQRRSYFQQLDADARLIWGRQKVVSIPDESNDKLSWYLERDGGHYSMAHNARDLAPDDAFFRARTLIMAKGDDIWVHRQADRAGVGLTNVLGPHGALSVTVDVNGRATFWKRHSQVLGHHLRTLADKRQDIELRKQSAQHAIAEAVSLLFPYEFGILEGGLRAVGHLRYMTDGLFRTKEPLTMTVRPNQAPQFEIEVRGGLLQITQDIPDIQSEEELNPELAKLFLAAYRHIERSDRI